MPTWNWLKRWVNSSSLALINTRIVMQSNAFSNAFSNATQIPQIIAFISAPQDKKINILEDKVRILKKSKGESTFRRSQSFFLSISLEHKANIT